MSEPSPRPRNRKRRLRRILWTALAILVVLPALIVVGVMAALQASGVRQAILGRISSLLAEDYGLAFTAKDFSPLWRRSGIELRDVRAGAPGAVPVATVRRLVAHVELGTLRSRPLVVRSLEVEGLRIDLAAPFPKLRETSREEAVSGPPLEIRRIRLRNGEVAGAPLTEPAAKWVRSWTGRGIAAHGSYRASRLELEIERGEAILDRPGFGLQALRLAGRVGYAEKQPLRIEDLKVTGEGLRLAASGVVGLEEGSPTAARFDLDAEPRAFAAGLPPRGRLRVEGQIALPENAGQLKILAKDIPAEALRPYLDPKLYGDLALAGTAADMNGNAVLGPGDWGRIAGTAELAWRRGSRDLASASANVSPGEAPAPIVAAVKAEILPSSPGRRFVQGTAHITSWPELAQATAEGVRAEVRLPDVRAALAEARALWPRLVPAPPPSTPIQGSLAAEARLAGSLASPDAQLDATWLPQPGSLVRVEAKGRPRTWSGSAKVRTETLPLDLLGSMAPGLAGSVSGTAEISGSPRGYRAQMEAVTTEVAFPPNLRRLESGRLIADGTLILRPLSYQGTVSLDGAGLVALPNASSTARLRSFQLATDGRLQAAPLRWRGKVTLNGEDAEVEGVGLADRFTAKADGTLATAPLAYEATLSLDADRVALAGQGTEIRQLHLEAAGDREEVRLSALSGELPEGRTFNASGRIVTEPLFAEADLDLRLVKPVDAVTAAHLTARLREGTLEVSAPRVETVSGPGNLKARVPLGALREVPQLASVLDSLPGEKAQGPVSFALDFPELDSEPLFAALGMEPHPERVRTGLAADLSLDLAAPAAGRGEVRLSGLSLETPDGRVTAEGPAVLRLADGRLDLAPLHLRVDGASIQDAGVDLQASADLARSWKPFENPPAAALTRVSAEANGTFDAALLNPYLQGGAAKGSITVSAKASGPPDRLAAEVQASGPDASFVWPAAALRVEDPRLAMDLRDGRWEIREGRLGVNDGSVNLAGGLTSEGKLDLEAQLSKVRYRLDYGIETLLSGRLALQSSPAERSRLSGRVVVERGVLNRDLNLDREVFTLLFRPPETPSTEESAPAGVDLDLEVETLVGVRVKNNVADLRASWRRLTVAGTLENPIVRGRIDIDSGGRFFAYGQTVRIESGSSLLFTGDPLTDPKIDLKTTSSLQDPTIAQLRGGGPLELLPQTSRKGDQDEIGEDEEGKGPPIQELLAAGLGGYYGGRVFERLGESLGLGRVSVVSDFENDPTARLIVERALSTSVSLALSVDLRNAERQTYLLDIHELPSLPGLRLEGFTNDESHEGTSLQQTFAFGGGVVSRETGPRLRRLEVSTPKKGVSKRQIRRAVGLEKRDPVPEGAAFAVEVDVADFLRRMGYPDPRITAAVRPVESRHGWVDVAVTVEPGPKASFVFEGDRPLRALRPEITGLYRTDFYEQSSIEEMRNAAVRAFRGSGHLDPQVTIEVRRELPEDPDGPRTVTLRSEAGPQVSLAELEIAGLDAEEERLTAAAFPGTLARAELAAGLPGADARLLGALHGLGYPQAKIAGRSVGAEGSRLVVNVEPGPRRTLAAVEVAGVEGEERRRLVDLLPLHAGDPARVDRVLRGAYLLESDLRQRGYADAVVRTSGVQESGRPGESKVVYRVTPGTRYELAGVELTGERWSRPAPLLRETGLAVGEPFSEAGVEEARDRLFATGVFSRVDAAVEKGSDGRATVSFSFDERPRFRLRYGVLWESEVGTSAVLDFVDQNFLGRAITMGVRGLYQPDDRSGRLYLRTESILGTRFSLDSFAEARRRLDPLDDNLMEDRREASLQLSHPLGEAGKAGLYARYRTTHLFEVDPDPFFPFDLEIRLPYVGVQLLRDTRDDGIDPRSGLFASLDLSGSGTFLGSDFQYVRLFAQASAWRDVSLAGRPLTWAQSLRAGYAHPFAGQSLISEERFFAGGPFSVRGYDHESLGPRESLLDVERILGGEALFIVNEELRIALPWDLTGLVFFDAGQVWAKPGDADFDLAKSLGLGLRARSPVGLLRLDAAYPLDRRPGEPRYKLYVGLGNAF
ncbi:MAG TPA: translocation/assembly module TamB domain-containing protein [Thermoanaerobaculia bacterium]|jgi:outer membrane protein assembly factor BamA|nr:translocation/assembly module TamB domain-containing protein [Thermoanaerobaculia bacterium]